MKLVRALQNLNNIPFYPPETIKQVRLDAVYNVLPLFDGQLSTDDVKVRWSITIEEIQLDKLVTRQAYLYRKRVQHYLIHQDEIDMPSYKGKLYDGYARVFKVDGSNVLGNGNHRVAAAYMLGRKAMKFQVARPKEVLL